jgi:branched-chain amino acid transport system substrate-binding protein
MERRDKTRSATVLALVALAGEAGCVLTTTPQEECRSNIECRDAFGLGMVCNGEGLCEAVEINERCTQTYPDDLLTAARRLDYKDHIVLGSIIRRDFEIFQKFERSAELAFVEANSRQGIDNRNFGVIFCNSDGSFEDGLEGGPEAAEEMATYLADVMSVPAIFGPATSSEAEAVFAAVRDKGVLVVSPSATSPSLARLDPDSASDASPGMFWRTATSDAFQGEAMVDDMRQIRAGRETAVDSVAIIYVDDAYGSGLFETIANLFQAAGGTVRAFPFVLENSGQPGQLLGEAVANASGAGSSFQEVVFASSDPDDYIRFLNAIKDLRAFDGKGIMLPAEAVNAKVLAEADSSRFSQVRGTRPKPLDPTRDLVYQRFLTSYQVAFDEDVSDDSFTANAHDAGWFLAFGAAWALLQEGELTGVNMARGLRQLSAGTPAEVGSNGWTTVLQQFTEGKPVNIVGASGALDFDGTTEETSTPIEVWSITPGKQILPLYTWP